MARLQTSRNALRTSPTTLPPPGRPVSPLSSRASSLPAAITHGKRPAVGASRRGHQVVSAKEVGEACGTRSSGGKGKGRRACGIAGHGFSSRMCRALHFRRPWRAGRYLSPSGWDWRRERRKALQSPRRWRIAVEIFVQAGDAAARTIACRSAAMAAATRSFVLTG